MSNSVSPAFTRSYGDRLRRRLEEPRRFLQVVTGSRQVGKTTLVRQVTERLNRPVHFASADDPTLRDPAWLRTQWEVARDAVGDDGAVLVVDEVQKVAGWPEIVKRYWDEDTHSGVNLQVVLLGSSPLLVEQGLGESLAGRFEVIHLPHWSLAEMRDGFDFSLDDYLFFGGYPGAAPLIGDPDRWRRYVLDSLVETTVSRDVLLLTRVEKPALLRRLLDLGCQYSGQVLSFNKMLGQLQDAGNTVTLAHYLELLAGAGLLTGLQKFSGAAVRRRASSPKLQVFNTALMSAVVGRSVDDAQADGRYWGRLVESAVGAHLANAAAVGECEVFYWRDRNREVDFVIRTPEGVAAVEVKSGVSGNTTSGLQAFADRWAPDRLVVVGGDGVPLQEFLSRPVVAWMEGA